jgi:hypothetical protein
VNAIYGLPRGVILHEYGVVYIRRAALPQARGFTSIWRTYVPFCLLSVEGVGAQSANENILIKGAEGNRRQRNWIRILMISISRKLLLGMEFRFSGVVNGAPRSGGILVSGQSHAPAILPSARESILDFSVVQPVA